MPDAAAVAVSSTRRGGRVFGHLASTSPYGFAIAAPHTLGGIAAGHAEIWSARVGGYSAHPTDAWLDDAERARAAAFHFDRDRRAFVERRAFLRRVLSGYLDVPPASIRYSQGRGARPELDPRCGVQFSTSHSEGLAVVAVALNRPVGIDIERLRPVPDALDLAASLFTAREFEHLRSSEAEDQSADFLRLWTRKEAYAKGLGVGLSLPLDAFEVLDDIAIQAVGGPADGARFALAPLDVAPDCVGSIAVSLA